jgi:hypothetical protein
MFDIAFSLESAEEDGSDVTPAMLRAALERRIHDLTVDADWLEACYLCDTYEVDAPQAIWLEDEIGEPVDPGVRRSLYDMLREHRPDLEIVEFECNDTSDIRGFFGEKK